MAKKSKTKTIKQTETNNETFLNLAWWMATVTAALMPLIFSQGLYEQWHLPKVAMVRIGFGLAAASWALNCARKKEVCLYGPSSMNVLVLFLVWAALSTIVSPDPNLSVWGAFGHFEGLLGLLVLATVFFLAVQLYRHDDRLTTLTSLVLAGAGLASLYGIVQYLGWDFLDWGEIPFGTSRVFSTFGNPTYLGTFLAAMVPLALGAVMRSRGGGYQRWVYLGVLMTISVGLVFTFTRGAWLAALVVALALILSALKSKENTKTALMALAVMAIVVTATIAGVMMTTGGRETISKRISSTFDISEGSVGSRVEIYKTAISITGNNPILGLGPDRFRYGFAKERSSDYVTKGMHPTVPDDAHNYFLTLSSTLGLPGCLLFALFFFWTCIRGWFASADLNRRAWLMSAMGVLIALMFTPTEIGGTFWLWFGLGVGAAPAALPWQNKPVVVRNIQMALAAAIGAMSAFLIVTGILLLSADAAYLSALRLYKEDPGQALVYSERAVRIYPYSETYQDGRGQLLLSKALALKDEEVFKQAVEAYQAGRRTMPGAYGMSKSLAAAYKQGAINFNPDYYGPMLEALNQAIRQNPKDAGTWSMIAEAYRGLGDTKEAAQAEERAARFTPAKR